jgi:hypothetical protein
VVSTDIADRGFGTWGVDFLAFSCATHLHISPWPPSLRRRHSVAWFA